MKSKAKSKRAALNVAAIVSLVLYFILVVGSTPIISEFLISNEEDSSITCEKIPNRNTTVANPKENTTVEHGSGDTICVTTNQKDTRPKLAIALVMGLSMPCLLILIVKITRTIQSRNKRDTELQLKDILELPEIDKHNILTQQQTELLKDMVDSTWLYDDRMGRDARSLEHNSIEVKQISRIYNRKLWKVYQSAHQVIGATDYPAELRENPILTMTGQTVSEGQNQGQVHAPSNQELELSNEQDAELSEAARRPDISMSQNTNDQHDNDRNSKDITDKDNKLETDKQNERNCTQFSSAHDEKKGHQNTVTSLNQNKDICMAAPVSPTISNMVHEVQENSTSPPNQDNLDLQDQTSSGSNIEQCSLRTAFSLKPNEVFLFHGTKLMNIPDILQGGFNVKISRKGLYGKGIYLAESSEKADQYADNLNNRRQQHLAILVVRVAMGQIVCHYSDEVVDRKAENLTRQSVVVAGMNKRFREFLVFDPKLLYPEFIVLYDRKV